MTKRKSKKTRKPRWLRLAAVVNVLALIAVYYAGFQMSGRNEWTNLVSYLPQPLFLLPALVILLALLFDRDFLGFLGTFLATGIVALALLQVHLPISLPAERKEDLRVLTFNMHHAKRGWENVERVIRESDADIVCLQEADYGRDHSRPAVRPIEGYHLTFQETLGVYSKEPVDDVSSINLGQGSLRALRVVTTGVQVVVVHLASFPESAREISNVHRTPDTFMRIARLHDRQIERLMQIDAESMPTLICGDFNMPPRGEGYHRLRTRYIDSFASVGRGFGYTFPSNLPIQRIDMVFATGLRPVRSRVLRTNVSDHRPLLSTFRLPRRR